MPKFLTTPESRLHYYMLVVLFAFSSCFLTLFVYVISFHRIKNSADFSSLMQVSRLSKVILTPESKHWSFVRDRCHLHDNNMVSCLPNVLFIGASKCGTTSMVYALSQLRNVYFIKRRIHQKDKHKEVHRFDRNTFGWAIRSIELADELASAPLFPLADLERFNPAVIHYTPHYLYAPTVPFEMRRFYPHPEQLKFIVMLRDPVDRAISSYWFQNSHIFKGVNKGSKADFLASVNAEMRQRRKYEKCMEAGLAGVNVGMSEHNSTGTINYLSHYMRLILRLSHSNHPYQINSTLSSCSHSSTNFEVDPAWDPLNRNQLERLTYRCFGASFLRSKQLGSRHLDKGVYVDQLLRWFANFHPNQFIFLSLREFSEDPAGSLKSLSQFLNLPLIEGGDNGSGIKLERKLSKPNNLSTLRENKLSNSEEELLIEFYKPYNKLLEAFFCTKVPK